jgi:hypothetical protein
MRAGEGSGKLMMRTQDVEAVIEVLKCGKERKKEKARVKTSVAARPIRYHFVEQNEQDKVEEEEDDAGERE